MAAKRPAPEPIEEAPAEPVEAEPEVNPASDPRLSAQERLAALTKQHEAMRKSTGGDYPL